MTFSEKLQKARKNKKLTINKDLDIETYCKENPNFTEIMVICS